jgi:hypothetical protein
MFGNVMDIWIRVYVCELSARDQAKSMAEDKRTGCVCKHIMYLCLQSTYRQGTNVS